MSDEEINNAIAAFCWPDCQPDYCADLNAMHQAEKFIAEMGVNKWWIYADQLVRNNPSPFGAETAIHATARQRAEAFLRTIGKWKEEAK